ncbi:MAG: hypothetical protein ACOCZX_02250 [Candidatus Bipolaricaulota bacterium]
MYNYNTGKARATDGAFGSTEKWLGCSVSSGSPEQRGASGSKPARASLDVERTT